MTRTKRPKRPLRARRARVARRPPVRPASRPRPAPRRFQGRDSSPVLDRYPAKGSATPAPLALVPAARLPTPPPAPAPAPGAAPPAVPGPSPPSAPAGAPPGLISLDRPFDIDSFSQSLGENAVRVVVPREDLAEVLRRVLDFMGFGIYVYSIRVRPEDSETLKRFVVELQRVDFSAARRAWVAFEEKGRSDSPFGPGSSAP